jgi:hypothetical protein
VDYHFVRERVAQKLLQIKFISSKDQRWHLHETVAITILWGLPAQSKPVSYGSDWERVLELVLYMSSILIPCHIWYIFCTRVFTFHPHIMKRRPSLWLCGSLHTTPKP